MTQLRNMDTHRLDLSHGTLTTGDRHPKHTIISTTVLHFIVSYCLSLNTIISIFIISIIITNITIIILFIIKKLASHLAPSDLATLTSCVTSAKRITCYINKEKKPFNRKGKTDWLSQKSIDYQHFIWVDVQALFIVFKISLPDFHRNHPDLDSNKQSSGPTKK